MLVTREKPSRHLTSMLFWLWTLHNKLSEKTKALSILSLTNITQAKFLMKTLLWWNQCLPIGGDLCRAEKHGRRLPSLPTPGWTNLCPCELLCFVLFSVFGQPGLLSQDSLEEFFPPPQLVLFNSVITESSFRNTFPSRLEEFYSVKQTNKTKTSSFCSLCTLCVLAVAHFIFHDHCLTSLPLIGLKVPQGWDLIYFCILSAKSRSLHIWATSKACND